MKLFSYYIYICFKRYSFYFKDFNIIGCGKHVEQVLKDVPEEGRCKCPKESAK